MYKRNYSNIHNDDIDNNNNEFEFKNKSDSIKLSKKIANKSKKLKKRKKVSVNSSNGSFEMKLDELIDPLQEKSFENESLEKEMNAMRQMFVLMSEKKRKQKEERCEEYKRMYIQAYSRDLSKVFRQAQKEAKEFQNEIDEDLKNRCEDLHQSQEQMVSFHQHGERFFRTEIDKVKKQILTMESLGKKLHQAYECGKKDIQIKFQQLNSQINQEMKQLQHNLDEIQYDTSFLKTFQPQWDRLTV